MKIFDIHAHIYPDRIAERAAAAIGSTYESVHVENDGRLSTLMRLADEAGITQLAVHSVATAPKQVASVNRFILESVQQYPDRLVPFAALHPDTEDLEDTVEAIVHGGFRGIKVHPECQGFLADEPRAVRMFDLIGGRLPVLIHCGDPVRDNSSPHRLKRLLREVPSLKLICAHFGGWTLWEEAAELLRDERVFADCSSSFYDLPTDTAVRIVRRYGSERVLYGTDYPVWTPKTEIGRLLALPLTDREKEDILWNAHENALQQ